jgi:glycosyltransferase involved in cell wall biosynthesis
VKTGLRHISGDYIIVQDADLEYDPRDILRLLKPVITGRAQIVFGSRNLHARNYPGHYLYFWGGKFFTLLFNLLFRTRFTDITTCYKLFPRSAVREILKLPSDDFAFDGIELTYALSRHGKVIEVPITYTGRKRGAGKKLSSWRDGWRFLRALFLLRFTPRRYFAPKRVASRPR